MAQAIEIFRVLSDGPLCHTALRSCPLTMHHSRSPRRRFRGVIKRYNADKHFGFIESSDLREDCLLSQRDINECQNGDLVSFEIGGLGRDGKPQAKNLELVLSASGDVYVGFVAR